IIQSSNHPIIQSSNHPIFLDADRSCRRCQVNQPNNLILNPQNSPNIIVVPKISESNCKTPLKQSYKYADFLNFAVLLL
ncbi:MAG: hypothetical protein PHT92_00920, partial [Bacteroidales bacterium]|nr:hypothetical protein [Bacteroidales bacterium]